MASKALVWLAGASLGSVPLVNRALACNGHLTHARCGSCTPGAALPRFHGGTKTPPDRRPSAPALSRKDSQPLSFIAGARQRASSAWRSEQNQRSPRVEVDLGPIVVPASPRACGRSARFAIDDARAIGGTPGLTPCSRHPAYDREPCPIDRPKILAGPRCCWWSQPDAG